MEKRITEIIAEHRLFNEGDTVVVAVSGGADSVALLDILVSMKALRLKLTVAHLNHTLRGAEADDDETFVRQNALRYGLPAKITRFDVRGFARLKKLSLEEAGRVARYDFLHEVARECGAHSIALAHHADDQAETVLMRLVRGSGATGLCAITPKSGRNLVRPLLTVTRREIEAYLIQRGLSYHNDSSNTDTDFLRNRIRIELLPFLETYNPAIRDRLVTTAAALARDEEVLEGVTDAAFARHCGREHHVVTLDVTGCRAELAGVRFRLYRRSILLAKGSLQRIGSGHLRDIDSMLFSKKPHVTLSLPEGMKVAKSYETVSFFMVPDEKAFPLYETAVEGPGLYLLPGGFRLTVEEVSLPEGWDDIPQDSALFDADAAPFPWLVRTFRAGDRIVPLGMRGHKKVKDLFIDEKIPLKCRRRLPLIFSGEKLLWVSTVRVSADGSVTERTRKVIRAKILDMSFLMDL